MAVADDDKDHFKDLLEDVLQLLLSFLPSRDAVRTSVLARRLRNLWKSVPSLRLSTDDDDDYGIEYESVQAFNNFVNKLLEFRDQTTPLDVCVIHPYPDGDKSEAHRYVKSWIQYAVSRKASVLLVQNSFDGHGYMQLSNSTVISSHLTVLDLYRLEFEGRPLDLVSCQALEVLEIDECFINLGNIFPKYLRHLKIIDSTLVSTHTRWSRISAPGLITFELSYCLGWTPLLESLPSLVTSFVKIGNLSEDTCYNKYLGDCGDESCDGCYVEDDCSVLLQGLSGATNLELLSEWSMIFRKDLKWCPMFGKLKTVLLDVWCMGANFTGLIYFLQRSPILERLTLQLPFNEHSDIEMVESYTPKEHFLVSKHLKVVEIYCREEEEMICQILRILGTHGVTPEQINVNHDFRDSSPYGVSRQCSRSLCSETLPDGVSVMVASTVAEPSV